MRPRYDYIERIANQLREKHGERLALDISALLHNLAIDWELADLPKHISGFSKLEDGKKKIALNRSNSFYRRRFTASHEVGHLLLHHDASINLNEGPIYFRDDQSSIGEHWKEIEANHFAACILMPRKKLLKELGESRDAISEDRITQIAKTFKVSPQAMCIRLVNLGFLTASAR